MFYSNVLLCPIFLYIYYLYLSNDTYIVTYMPDITSFITGHVQIIIFYFMKDLNSVFSLSLMTYSDVFDVVPSVAMSTATVLIRVKNSTQLDYETIKNMTLTVSVTFRLRHSIN